MDNVYSDNESPLDLSKYLNPNIEEMGIETIAFVLLVSLLASLFISALYLLFYGKNSTGSQMHRALPMLGLSITGIFITIQFSLPLSLGLLGALSIIRFRTPIKEPEEIGFIMLVIAVSLGCATFNLYFIGAFLVIAIIGLITLKFVPSYRRAHSSGGLLLVRLANARYDDIESDLIERVSKLNKKIKLQSISRNSEQTSITYDLKGIKNLDQSEVISLIAKIDPSIEIDVYLNDSRISAY